MTLVLRFRVRTLPVSRGRSVSKLVRLCCRRLGAVPMDEGARDEGDTDSFSQALVCAEFNRDVGGRDKLAEDDEGRTGVRSRDVAVRRPSAFPLLPGRRKDEFAGMSMDAPLTRRLAALVDATRSGLEDIARPDGVCVIGEGGPESGAGPSAGRSDTDLVIRGTDVKEEGRRGVRAREVVGTRRDEVLAVSS